MSSQSPSYLIPFLGVPSRHVIVCTNCQSKHRHKTPSPNPISIDRFLLLFLASPLSLSLSLFLSLSLSLSLSLTHTHTHMHIHTHPHTHIYLSHQWFSAVFCSKLILTLSSEKYKFIRDTFRDVFKVFFVSLMRPNNQQIFLSSQSIVDIQDRTS